MRLLPLSLSLSRAQFLELSPSPSFSSLLLPPYLSRHPSLHAEALSYLGKGAGMPVEDFGVGHELPHVREKAVGAGVPVRRAVAIAGITESAHREGRKEGRKQR